MLCLFKTQKVLSFVVYLLADQNSEQITKMPAGAGVLFPLAFHNL
jgi:hypothetical protein